MKDTVKKRNRVDSVTARQKWTKVFEVSLNKKPKERDIGEVITWLFENINDHWAYPTRNTFLFESEQDVMGFKLRWSEFCIN